MNPNNIEEYYDPTTDSYDVMRLIADTYEAEPDCASLLSQQVVLATIGLIQRRAPLRTPDVAVSTGYLMAAFGGLFDRIDDGVKRIDETLSDALNAGCNLEDRVDALQKAAEAGFEAGDADSHSAAQNFNALLDATRETFGRADERLTEIERRLVILENR